MTNDVQVVLVLGSLAGVLKQRDAHSQHKTPDWDWKWVVNISHCVGGGYRYLSTDEEAAYWLIRYHSLGASYSTPEGHRFLEGLAATWMRKA